LNYTRA